MKLGKRLAITILADKLKSLPKEARRKPFLFPGVWNKTNLMEEGGAKKVICFRCQIC